MTTIVPSSSATSPARRRDRCGARRRREPSRPAARGPPAAIRPRRRRRSCERGGTITVLSAGDVDHIDPGQAYYSFTYEITYATQRPLLAFKPRSVQQYPDLAAAMPKVSTDGRTVTVHIKHGVRFSPPVNREVTSADVKYAIERGFDTSVANGYAAAYFGDLVGAPTKPAQRSRTSAASRRRTRTTLVFKLQAPVRRLRRRPRPADDRTGAGVLRDASSTRRRSLDLRPAPGRNRAVHDQERRLRQRSTASATSRTS